MTAEATTLQDSDFADDLTLLCHTFDDQQELTDELARTAGTVGLFTTTSKTQFMNSNAGDATLRSMEKTLKMWRS